MTKTKLLLTLTAFLVLMGGTAHANQNNEAETTEPVVDLVQKKDFVYIPLKIVLRVEEVPRIEKDLSDEFETVIIGKIGYDLVEDIDANIGLLKTDNVDSRYGIESGALPRGRYFEPLNSKLGAGISRKF